MGKVAAQVGQELVWVQNACLLQTETKTETGSSSQGYVALGILWLALIPIPSPPSFFADNSKARYLYFQNLIWLIEEFGENRRIFTGSHK